MKTQNKEQWKDVLGYEGIYKISDLGRVKSLARTNCYGRKLKEKILRTSRHTFGYRLVNLQQNGVRTWQTIHKLVLGAFVGPRPEGMECRHLDGNPENNRLDNLKWGTPTENAKDRARHNTECLGEDNPRAELCDLDAWLIRNCDTTQQKLAEFFGVSQTMVSRIRRNKAWTHIS